ncbi:MAG: 50S ribosomal protein L11 methyltransferase [Gammaproteobacteria bacterium]|jgi:ribosomal protein L11 methyltransferase
MNWLRLTVTVRPPFLDDLKDLLEKFGSDSVSYAPASKEPLFGDDSSKNIYWDLTSVSALFIPDIDLDILMACIRNRLGDKNIDSHTIEFVSDDKWGESYKSGFQPMVFANKLCICPSWLEKPKDIAHVIELDPGLAFGTGTHATTALCLEWLANQQLKGLRVIDYGCGSGILGISAASLGARQVNAVDIDQQALDATNRNAIQNGLESRINTLSPDDTMQDMSDILIANILLKPLLSLAQRFKSLLDVDGKIVLSGILVSQVDECMKIYTSWFDMKDPVYRNEWAMLSGVRNKVK